MKLVINEMPAAGRLDAIAAEVKQLHGDVQEGLRLTLPKAIRIGELLMHAKAELPHGRWLPWISDNCAFNEATAQRYMLLHKHRAEIEANNSPGSYLGVRATAAALAKPRRSKQDRVQLELRALIMAWERAGREARAAFLRRLGYKPVGLVRDDEEEIRA